MNTGKVPDQLNIAKSIPIYKSNDKKLVSNYRPISNISILPFFSKITDNQFGFRKALSTYMALIKLMDEISNELHNKNLLVVTFIDLSKAVSTIDHALLCQKLEYYGIRGIALDWFTNYLNNRKQFVNLNGIDSSLLTILCRSLRDQSLGHCFFNYY